MPAALSSTKSAVDASSHRRKTRIVKRRGRAVNGAESDDEIVREITSDDDTDDSSVDSESETESLSDDHHLNGRSEVVTPSTTQSPPPPELDGRVSLANGITPKQVESGPFVATTDWADMVASEHANGTEDLPVIDFADLGRSPLDQHLVSAPRSRKVHKQGKRSDAQRSTSAPPAPPLASPPAHHVEEPDGDDAHEQLEEATSFERSDEHRQNRSRGQTARQAYQQRLETDPSFVPKVGEFWGHDDRLLEKDLRSLSGWWRGRWQSRGRGRSAFTMRGRGGRGGFAGGRPPNDTDEFGEEQVDGAEVVDEVPPVEKTWTHDGFEEMKRRDEQRRQRVQDQQQPARFGPQRGFAFRGRGGFFGGRGRGGWNPGFLGRGTADRPWFAMKPEREWTKHHEAFLYFDPALKPRPGQGPGYRVKLPGGPEHIIRGPPRSYPMSQVGFEDPSEFLQDETEKIFTVRIPPRAGKEKAKEETQEVPAEAVNVEESATTMAELSIEEVFTVRPNIVPNRRIEIPIPQKQDASPPSEPSAPPSLPPPSVHPMSHASHSTPSSQQLDTRGQQQHISPLSLDPLVLRPTASSPSPIIKETVLRRPSLSTQAPLTASPSTEAPRPAPPALHPLQTSFSPVPQTPPSYNPSYGYGVPLPPGVAFNHHGMPYELATGRPVILQSTPPPMFTPRPMMHGHVPHPSHSYVPAHMHHHSTVSPDFLAHPHTPPVGQFVDPATGVPFFTPARQSSRIEIRAPDGTDGKKATRPSGLRTSMSSSEAYPDAQLYQPTDMDTPQALDEESIAAPNGLQHIEQPQPLVAEQPMAYPAYQPYYYPDAYAYPTYMDMSPQVMHYEMYPPADHRTPQPPMIYY